MLKQNKYYRIDDEYFNKKYRHLDKKIEQKGYNYLKDISNQITDFGAYSQTNLVDLFDKGVLFLRNQDVKQNYLELENNVFINDEVYNLLSLKLQENDVIIPRVGTLGNATVIKKEYLPCSANQNLAVIRLKEKISPYFISTILTSSIGILQVNRISTGNVQQWLNLEAIGNIKIPNISFQKEIEHTVLNAHSILNQSKSFYSEAENILFEELGLTNWQPTIKNNNTKTLKESFLVSGRMDAEYYQPKYDEVENFLSKFERIALKDLVESPIVSGSTPTAGESEYYTDAQNGVPFIRAVDIIDSRINLGNVNYIRDEVHNGLLKRTQIKQNDILISIAGTVGRAGIYEDEIPANINQACAIIRFTPIKVSHLYFITFFNSLMGKLVIEREARQGLQTNLNLQELGGIKIPILDFTIQSIIENKVLQSFQLLKQSKMLLNAAKRAVEIAIDQDERTALNYLKNLSHA